MHAFALLRLHCSLHEVGSQFVAVPCTFVNHGGHAQCTNEFMSFLFTIDDVGASQQDFLLEAASVFLANEVCTFIPSVLVV